jgi:hypothetical protein
MGRIILGEAHKYYHFVQCDSLTLQAAIYNNIPRFLRRLKNQTLFDSLLSIHFRGGKMEPSGPSNPLLSLSTFIHHHCLRLGAEFSTRISDTTRFLGGNLPPPRRLRLAPSPPFASVSQPKQTATTANLSSDHVAKTLAGTAVYTVSNSNNEFVLISDPNGAKSIGLLCFRQEDAEAFLAQVQYFNSVTRYMHMLILSMFCGESFSPPLDFEVQVRLRRRELRSQAKVVPITLDQVIMSTFNQWILICV